MMMVAGGLLALALYAQRANHEAEHTANTPAPAPGNVAANAAATAANTATTVAAATGNTAPDSPTAMTVATAPADGGADTTLSDETRWFIEGDVEDGRSLPSRKEAIGSLDPSGRYAMQLELVTDGAAIYTVQLAQYFTTVADLRAGRPPADHAEYLARVERREPGLLGHYSLLNPVAREGDAAGERPLANRLDDDYGKGLVRSFGESLHLPLATRSVELLYDGRRTDEFFDIEKRRWKIQSVHRHEDGRQEIVFTLGLLRALPGEPKKPYIELAKTYTLYPVVAADEEVTPGVIDFNQRPYSVRVTLTARNLSSDPDDACRIVIDQAGVTGVPREDLQRDLRRLAWARMEKGGTKPMPQRRGADEKKMPDSEDLGSSKEGQPLLWVSQTNKFFAGVLYLMAPDENLIPDRPATWHQRRIVETFDRPTSTINSKTFLTGVRLEMTLAAAGTAGGKDSDSLTLDLFVGPKRTELFNNTPMYDALNYTGTIELGQGCCAWCTFEWLSKMIMAFLEFLARHVTGGNYGVAIIVLVIIVRILLHPLTKRGQISMSKMAKLAPKMKELQEKYKNDKDTLNREMLKHSKEQGTGMFMGCLPMLMQLPIWMALYSGLQADAELRHAQFLPVWITDLAGPDAILRFENSVHIPIIGTVASLNLLPILLSIAMYFQAKLTPTPAAPATTPEQEMQQKMQKRMMQIMTPIMMLLFFYNAPSGLNLYIMTSTFSSVFEQMIIRKHIRERDAAAAAAGPTEIVVPTKASRDNRPKKPKGPFWHKGK